VTWTASDSHRLSEHIQEHRASSSLPEVSVDQLNVLWVPPAAFVLVKAPIAEIV